MSSFGTIEFKVRPDSGFFPNVEDGGGDDPPKYECDAVLLSTTARVGMLGAVSRGTAHRILGTRVWNWHGEAGPLPTTLSVPVYTGNLLVYSKALLVALTDLRGYGRAGNSSRYFECHLEFWILSEITITP